MLTGQPLEDRLEGGHDGIRRELSVGLTALVALQPKLHPQLTVNQADVRPPARRPRGTTGVWRRGPVRLRLHGLRGCFPIEACPILEKMTHGGYHGLSVLGEERQEVAGKCGIMPGIGVLREELV